VAGVNDPGYSERISTLRRDSFGTGGYSGAMGSPGRIYGGDATGAMEK